eukprot:COSAG01_NODE_2010_length_8657_cov_6.034237_1_plen_81_part_00
MQGCRGAGVQNPRIDYRQAGWLNAPDKRALDTDDRFEIPKFHKIAEIYKTGIRQGLRLRTFQSLHTAAQQPYSHKKVFCH